MENTTLAQQLQPSAIDFELLHANYRPMLRLVRELIGVIPDCDPLLEIWPIGFRTYYQDRKAEWEEWINLDIAETYAP